MQLSTVLEDVAALVAILGAVIAAGHFLADRLSRRGARRQTAASVDEAARVAARTALNHAFSGRAEIVSFPLADPPLVADDPADYPVDATITASAAELRAGLDAAGRNELHALLTATPPWQDETYSLTYQKTDFATIRALRAAGRPFPPIITANVLACCATSDEVYLLRRAADVATYPGHLHVLGGNFTAEGARFDDRGRLRRTAEREFAEETGLQVHVPDDCPRVSVIEHSDDGTREFYQLTYLGLNVAAELGGRLEHSTEGTITARSLHAVGDALMDPDEKWVPTAKLYVLLWLALGAPTFGDAGRYDSAEARALYGRWLTSVTAR